MNNLPRRYHDPSVNLPKSNLFALLCTSLLWLFSNTRPLAAGFPYSEKHCKKSIKMSQQLQVTFHSPLVNDREATSGENPAPRNQSPSPSKTLPTSSTRLEYLTLGSAHPRESTIPTKLLDYDTCAPQEEVLFYNQGKSSSVICGVILTISMKMNGKLQRKK